MRKSKTGKILLTVCFPFFGVFRFFCNDESCGKFSYCTLNHVVESGRVVKATLGDVLI